MLVRLLVAVLMVTGPTPVRVCTCAVAAHAPQAPAVGSLVEAPSERSKACGCGHRAAAKESPRSAESSAAKDCGFRAAGSPPSQPERHDRDCPSVNPRPAVSAVVTPVADVPADACDGLFVLVALPAFDRLGVSERVSLTFSPFAIPLYLSLLSLRI